jgi:hypothetical protein
MQPACSRISLRGYIGPQSNLRWIVGAWRGTTILSNPTAVVLHTDRSPGGPIPSWNDRRFHTGRSSPLAVAAKVHSRTPCREWALPATPRVPSPVAQLLQLPSSSAAHSCSCREPAPKPVLEKGDMLQYAAGVLPDIPSGIYRATIQPPLDCGCVARADNPVEPDRGGAPYQPESRRSHSILE